MSKHLKLPLNHRIIGITGKMGSGKSTVADLIFNQLAQTEYYPKIIKFAAPLYEIQDYIQERCGLPKEKDRMLLQWLGTEWGRSKDENFWVNLWRKEVRAYRHKWSTAGQEYDRGVVICDDIRFDNEAEQVKALGGVIISVEAPEEVRAQRIPIIQGDHASEKGINQKYIDQTIYNDSDMMALRLNVKYRLQDGLL